MKSRYSKAELSEMFFEALDLFNDYLDSDISKENTIISFFEPSNGIEVYEELCKEHFPDLLAENYMADGYFESFAAQAFVNDKEYGVLIRSDIGFSLPEIHRTFLHEISHLYCTKNEIQGGHFFDRYCMGSGAEDGLFNAGYAIWREAIADIMADSVLSESTTVILNEVKPEVDRLVESLSIANEDSKKCMSLVIAYIMLSKEVAGTKSWSTAEAEIEKCFCFKDSMLVMMLRLVFDNLHEPPFWQITPEFIQELGGVYIAALTFRTFRKQL